MPASAVSIASCLTPERYSVKPQSVKKCSVSARSVPFYAGPRASTHDLLVIPELEVILHHSIFVPINVQEVRR